MGEDAVDGSNRSAKLSRRRLIASAAAFGLAKLAVPLPGLAAARGARITDIRTARIKVVRDLGTYSNTFQTPAIVNQVRIGGGTMTEIYSDQGLIGIGPGASPETVRIAKTFLIGKDPTDIAVHARRLSAMGREGANIENALWDLVGKLADMPLYKLWGGGMERVLPYGALLGIGDGPEERARAAVQVRAAGFKAVKLRSSYATFREDVRLVELTRKALGDDFMILTDGNKAGGLGTSQLNTVWDLPRAIATAREYQRLGVHWLEEPLNRFAYDDLAELNRSVDIRLAGGEVNTRLDEFRTYLEKASYDVLMADVNVIGPYMFRQVQDYAFVMNRVVSCHGVGSFGPIFSMHLAASQPQNPTGAMFTGPHIEVPQNPPLTDYREQWSIFENPPVLDSDGWLPMPTGPGWGVTVKADLIDRA